MKKIYRLFALLFVALFFSGCQKHMAIDRGTTPDTSISGATASTIDHSDLTGSVQTVLSALKNQDFLTLAKFVGRSGLRFSPYEYVNTGTDVIMDTDLVAHAQLLSRTFLWGSYDGSGLPIDLSVGQYFEKFVNDADYTHAPEILYNQHVQRGNTINNIPDVYQGKTWIEFHFTGFDAQYGGIDRKSLRLVWNQVDGQRELIGIVHGQWTI